MSESSSPKRTVSVRGYWRCSPSGLWHWVSKHERGFRTVLAERTLPTVGRPWPAQLIRATPEDRPQGAPWVEHRYLMRWRVVSGRKFSRYINAEQGQALIARRRLLPWANQN